MLYKNKYRIPSARVQKWDYRTPAPYFITIDVRYMKHVFGAVIKGEMHLNNFGQCANESMENINILTQNAIVTNHIIMPSHVHAIIELKNDKRDYQCNRFGPLLKKSLSSVINHFKGRVTRYAKKNNLEFEWKERFHDHIIRDPFEYQRIFNYITDNPINWEKGKSGKK